MDKNKQMNKRMGREVSENMGGLRDEWMDG